jgi:hypothetical protein
MFATQKVDAGVAAPASEQSGEQPACNTKKSVGRPKGKANLRDVMGGRFLSFAPRYANDKRVFALLCELSMPEHDQRGEPTGWHEVTVSDRKLSRCIGVSKKTIARSRKRLHELFGAERFASSALAELEALDGQRDDSGRFLASNDARARRRTDVHCYRFEFLVGDDELEERRRRKAGGHNIMMAAWDESLGVPRRGQPGGWKPAEREVLGWYIARRNADDVAYPSIDGAHPGQRGRGQLAQDSGLSRSTLYRARQLVELRGALERRTHLDENGRPRRRFKVLVTPERDTNRLPESYRRQFFESGHEEIAIGTRRDRDRDTKRHEVGSSFRRSFAEPPTGFLRASCGGR